MRTNAPFQPDDLADLEESFYAKAARVVALEDVYDGHKNANVIGLRHDCDAGHSLATAVKMAHWEQERGYRSTYYLLHTSPYWNYDAFPEMVDEIASCGHEIGIHVNALAESFRTGEDPDLILERALERLRGLGYQVRGAAGHGDRLCSYDAAEDEPWFANDEQFAECRRTRVAHVRVDGPGRRLWRGQISRILTPRPLADFGLEYEAIFLGLPYPFRFSDSGGNWCDPGWDETVLRFGGQTEVARPARGELDPRQLHMLVHPDWWAEAFQPTGVLA